MTPEQLEKAKVGFEKWDREELSKTILGDKDDRIIILHHNKNKSERSKGYLAGYEQACNELFQIKNKLDLCLKENKKLRELSVKLLTKKGFDNIEWTTEQSNLIDDLIGRQSWSNA